MKIKKLLLSNIGIVEREEIAINKRLIVFYGEIRAGKSTILKSVIWVCGGEFPSDILRHGTKEGFIELQFDNGHIRREFYLAKDGKTIKARSIEFIRDNRPVDRPVAEIEKLLNPFSLDQDFLVRKNEMDRNKYFIELFGVDTSDLDAELVKLESAASAARSELKGFGDVDLTEHKPVDVEALQSQRSQIINAAAAQRAELEAQLASISEAHNSRVQAFHLENAKVLNLRTLRATHQSAINAGNTEIRELQIRIGKLQDAVKQNEAWLDANPDTSDPTMPMAPDTIALKQQILALHSPDTLSVDKVLSDASAANVRAEQYQKNLEREKQRLAKAAALATAEAAIKEKRQAKLDRLKSINETCKIEGMKFTDGGEFSFEGTSAQMLSTSQLMRLSKMLSDLYPAGLGIQLLDRGESLGKSIFSLIDRAKAEDKTILASVVGERPAVVPEQVGVFVVSEGKIQHEQAN
jgi:hypothetical protein